MVRFNHAEFLKSELKHLPYKINSYVFQLQITHPFAGQERLPSFLELSLYLFLWRGAAKGGLEKKDKLRLGDNQDLLQDALTSVHRWRYIDSGIFCCLCSSEVITKPWFVSGGFMQSTNLIEKDLAALCRVSLELKPQILAQASIRSGEDSASPGKIPMLKTFSLFSFF